MASTGVNVSVVDVAVGRAIGRGVDRYEAEHPDTTDADICTAIGRRPGWLSEVRAGRESARARDLKALAHYDMYEGLIELGRLCGAHVTLLPKEGNVRAVGLADAEHVIKETSDAVCAVVRQANGANRVSAGEKLDALREIDEAIYALIETRRLVESQRVDAQRAALLGLGS